MTDDPLVQAVAREYLLYHGAKALERLLELAELAEALGDRDAAINWLEIAEAVEKLLQLNLDPREPSRS